MGNFKIMLQFFGDLWWNHTIYDVNEGRIVSNTACCILIVRRAKIVCRSQMDPVILELLRQFGWTYAAIAVIVSLVITAVFNVGIFYVNQKIQQRREERLAHIRAELEKELAEFKAREIKEIENVQQARWELKYRACLDAMEIVDAFLSHWFKDVNNVKPVRQVADTVKARECYNRLVLTCENPQVTELFLKIMFPTPQTDNIQITDNLNALRNAVRAELGFGSGIVLSKEVAWFVRLAGDNRDEVH